MAFTTTLYAAMAVFGPFDGSAWTVLSVYIRSAMLVIPSGGFIAGLIIGGALASLAAYWWWKSKTNTRAQNHQPPSAPLAVVPPEPGRKGIEERYRDLFENAHDAVFIVGLDGRVTLSNRRFHEVTGYSSEEVVGSSFTKYIHPGDLPTALERFKARVQEQDLSSTHTFRVVKKDGDLVTVELSFGLFREDGRVAGIQGIARDITKHTWMAKALRESEEKYKTLVENSLTGIYLVQDGKYKFANRRFIEMTGYTEGELIGKIDPIELTHPDDRERIAEMMRRRLKGELTPTEYEMRGIRKDGNIVPIKVLSNRVMYRGRPAVIGTILDLSIEKEIEDRYRNILENALEGIYQSSPDGRLLMVNQAFVQMFGFDSAEEMLAIPATSILYADPDDQIRFRRMLMRKDYVTDVELKLKRKDGSVFYVEESARVVRAAPGEVRYYEGILQDITERKRSAERMRSIYEVATSLAGDTQEVLDQLVSNIAATFQTRYALLGEMDSDTVNIRASFSAAGDPLSTYRLRGTPCEGVLEHGQSLSFSDDAASLFPDNEIFQALHIRSYLGCPLFDSKRQVIGIACVFDPEPHHFTEADEQLLRIYAQRAASEIERGREAAEKEKVRLQLIQAQKMESVGTLAGGIAHDFNNLLTVILGYSSLMLGEIDATHPWYEQLRQIEKTAQRGSQLTSQMLAFSRRAITQPTNVDLNAVVNEMLGILQRSLDPSIQIQCRLDPSVWTIRADHAQVQHVLMNLCVNARDAMSDRGILTIETSNVTLDEEAIQGMPDAHIGRYVVLSVEDTGTGMDSETMERIFEPFFTTKKVGKGTGLGLSMVYGIVKTHGGYVQVQSELGRGTRFDVAFPAMPEAAEYTGDLASLRGTESLLLVDDEALVLELGKAVLQRFGYQVTTAQNGNEAIAQLQQRGQEISLAIVDVTMPGMNGIACVKELRKLCPELKAVLASGSTDDVGFNPGDIGEIKLIQKPYRIHDLLRTVRESLQS